MSSGKNAGKGTKKDRDGTASGKGKRRGNVSNASHTSDEGITPVSSRAEVAEPMRHPLDEALSGEEIDALKIKDEDLQKLHQPKPPTVARPEQTIRKILLRKHKSLTKQAHKKVAVLKLLPPGSEANNTVTLGAPVSGPRYDCTGVLLPHSVLGRAEDYAILSGQAEQKPVQKEAVHVVPPSVKMSHHYPSETCCYERSIIHREANALAFWESAAAERRKQQKHIIAAVKNSPDRLRMNQVNDYRTIQEERTMLEQLIPPFESGKGYHVGSEFWRQQVQLGDMKTGLNITLTETEKGKGPPLEFVGIPNIVKKELGMLSSSEKNAPLHHTWRGSSYLAKRKTDLEFDKHFHKPEMSELQVVGSGKPQSPVSLATRSASLDSLDSSASEDEEPNAQVNPLASITDIVERPIIGPALCIGDHMLLWEEPPSVIEDVSPIEERVLFEGGPGEAVTVNLDLVNSGTTALYYSWEQIPNPNPLGTILHEGIQRFYFDMEGGVLLPGQSFSFPFMFKSAKAGIFTEKWLLCTGPMLAGGRPICIVLKGIACQEDQYEKQRMEIDVKLNHRQATRMARQVVKRLVNSIRTPPVTPPPVMPSTMEEDIFATINPGIPYQYDVVARLKLLYEEIMRPPEVAEETSPSTTAHSSVAATKEKSTSGKKTDEGKGKKDKSSKEKKSSKMKDREMKEIKEEPPPPPKVPTSSNEQLKLNIPKWDLSIQGLQQLIMAIDDDESREEKLVELNNAMAALSFAVQPKPTERSYAIGYQIVCELIDKMVDSSIHLRHILGLPAREFTRVSCSDTQMQEEQVVLSPGKDKKDKNEKKAAFNPTTGKDKKEGKQKLQASKEEGTKGSKSVGTKKSKTAISPVKAASDKTVDESAAAIAEKSELDEAQEKKYLQLVLSSVYSLMRNSVENLALSLSESHCI